MAEIDMLIQRIREAIRLLDKSADLLAQTVLTQVRTDIARFKATAPITTHTAPADQPSAISAEQVVERVQRGIRDWRRQNKTLRELAKLTGISASQLSRISSGRQQPTLRVAWAILELQNLRMSIGPKDPSS